MRITTAEIPSSVWPGGEIRASGRGWTQAQLAKAAGVHRRYLSDIERGELNPSLQIQDEIATALEMSLSDLLADAERERDRRRVAR